jgi:hypothetical protein
VGGAGTWAGEHDLCQSGRVAAGFATVQLTPPPEREDKTAALVHQAAEIHTGQSETTMSKLAPAEPRSAAGAVTTPDSDGPDALSQMLPVVPA